MICNCLDPKRRWRQSAASGDKSDLDTRCEPRSWCSWRCEWGLKSSHATRPRLAVRAGSLVSGVGVAASVPAGQQHCTVMRRDVLEGLCLAEGRRSRGKFEVDVAMEMRVDMRTTETRIEEGEVGEVPHGVYQERIEERESA